MKRWVGLTAAAVAVAGLAACSEPEEPSVMEQCQESDFIAAKLAPINAEVQSVLDGTSLSGKSVEDLPWPEPLTQAEYCDYIERTAPESLESWFGPNGTQK